MRFLGRLDFSSRFSDFLKKLILSVMIVTKFAEIPARRAIKLSGRGRRHFPKDCLLACLEEVEVVR